MERGLGSSQVGSEGGRLYPNETLLGHHHDSTLRRTALGQFNVPLIGKVVVVGRGGGSLDSSAYKLQLLMTDVIWSGFKRLVGHSVSSETIICSLRSHYIRLFLRVADKGFLFSLLEVPPWSLEESVMRETKVRMPRALPFELLA